MVVTLMMLYLQTNPHICNKAYNKVTLNKITLIWLPPVNDTVDAQQCTVYVCTMDSRCVVLIILESRDLQLHTSIAIDNYSPNSSLVNSYNAVQLSAWHTHAITLYHKRR